MLYKPAVQLYPSGTFYFSNYLHLCLQIFPVSDSFTPYALLSMSDPHISWSPLATCSMESSGRCHHCRRNTAEVLLFQGERPQAAMASIMPSMATATAAPMPSPIWQTHGGFVQHGIWNSPSAARTGQMTTQKKWGKLWRPRVIRQEEANEWIRFIFFLPYNELL